MINSLNSIIFLLCVSFSIYGWACLKQAHMIKEFNRYGLNKYRTLVGYLELMGALGLLLGLKWKILLLMSSAGLSVLMLLGFLVRLKIKDKTTLLLPSFIYMLLSIYVFINVI